MRAYEKWINDYTRDLVALTPGLSQEEALTYVRKLAQERRRGVVENALRARRWPRAIAWLVSRIWPGPLLPDFNQREK